MSSLAASIKELGVLQPVLVRQIGSVAADDFELIAGERRWRAARRAGLQSIPVLVLTSDETQSLEQALVENLHRQDLNVLEEAAAYQQLIEEFGYTHEQVASGWGRAGRPSPTSCAFSSCPPESNGCFPRGRSARDTPALSSELPIVAIRRCWPRRWCLKGLTVRAIEEMVREHNGGGEDGGSDRHVGPGPGSRRTESRRPLPPSQRLPPPGILELEELLSGHLNTRVKVDLTSKRGKVVVEFATLEDLERIYKLMVGAECTQSCEPVTLSAYRLT